MEYKSHHYFIQVEIDIEPGIVSPEDLKKAKMLIPEDYNTVGEGCIKQISIKENKASILIACLKKNVSGKSFAPKTGKNVSKNTY